ncbi:hypothetical protein SNE40_007667 [Patella caerulea]|uniref:LRRCT domain-containing protein n=1 Tax=Patella caerulea TaxID=87958 RepID=A0AAN8PVC6_PATCE
MLKFSLSCDLTTCPQYCTCDIKNENLTVDCSRNARKQSPVTVPICENVSLLINVSSNELTELVIRRYEQYTTVILDASNNQIRTISSELKNRVLLNELNIENNSLEKIPMDLKSSFENMQTVHLKNNSWKCDCELDWLVSLIKSSIIEKENKFTDIDMVTCSNPKELVNIKLKDFDSQCDSHDGKDKSALKPWQIVLIVFGILFYLSLASAIGFCIVLRRRIRITAN